MLIYTRLVAYYLFNVCPIARDRSTLYHTYGIRYNENGLLRVTLKTGIYSGASFVGTLEEAEAQLSANPILHRVREILELAIVFYSLLEKNEIYMMV